MQVSYIILRVADMERSLGFYRDTVGLAVLVESPAFSFLDAGSIQLVLSVPAEPVVADRSMTEIVLEVDEVHAAHAAMAERGVEFRVPPREVMREGDRGLYAAEFQ